MMNMANPYVENDFEIGDILYTSWGYDQTNVEFFQVVGKTAKTIKVREIRADVKETGFMCGHSMPVKDDFQDRPWYGNGRSEFTVQCRRYMRSPLYGGLWKWDGEPKYTSWYA